MAGTATEQGRATVTELAVPEFTQEQAEHLDALAGTLNEFTVLLRKLDETGLKPSAALEAIGIEVPGMFKGTVDRLLTQVPEPEADAPPG